MSAHLVGSASRSNWDADCKKTPFTNGFETLSRSLLVCPHLQARVATSSLSALEGDDAQAFELCYHSLMLSPLEVCK